MNRYTDQDGNDFIYEHKVTSPDRPDDGPQEGHHEAPGYQRRTSQGGSSQLTRPVNILIDVGGDEEDVYCADCMTFLSNLAVMINHTCLPANTVQSHPGQ